MNKAQLSVFIFASLIFLNIESSIEIADKGVRCMSNEGVFFVSYYGGFVKIPIQESTLKDLTNFDQCRLFFGSMCIAS